MKRLIILATALSFMLSCEKGTIIDSVPIENCNFSQSIEELNELIEKCNDNQFNSTSEIEDNLIGDWTLSGIKSAWFPFEPSSECLLLSIAAESFTLTNLDTGEKFNSTWNLTNYEVNGNAVFYLEPTDDDLRWQVGMQFFSQNIMYGAGLADDSDIYVYEKVN